MVDGILAGHIPTDWQNSILVPLFKGKGDPFECGSFRAIKILDQAMNVWERVLEVWLKTQVEIGEIQFGFMLGEELLMPFSLYDSCMKNFWPGIRSYLGFDYLEEAFDRVVMS